MELLLSTTHNARSKTKRLMREERLPPDLIPLTLYSFGAQSLVASDLTHVSDWSTEDRRTPQRLHACSLRAKYST